MVVDFRFTSGGFGVSLVGVAAVVGYGLHIISDQISHNRGNLWYFLSFRVWGLPNRIRKH